MLPLNIILANKTASSSLTTDEPESPIAWDVDSFSGGKNSKTKLSIESEINDDFRFKRST